MPLTPPPRLATPPDAGDFTPSAPAPGDADVQTQDQAPETSTPPGAVEDTKYILLITSSARLLAQKYPTIVPEVQQINDAVQKIQMKMQSIQPPAQVAIPPQ